MNVNLKNTIIRVTALLLFFAMMAAVILWQSGVYDVSFIKRPIPAVDESTAAGSDTAPSDTAGQDTDSAPATETELNGEDMAAILEMILPYSEAEKAGLVISERKFSENSSIARIALDLGDRSRVFSSRTEEKTDTVVYRKSNGYYSTKQVTETVNAPTVSLYFGLIVIDFGDRISIMNKNGKLLIDDFKGTFLYAKTTDGKPAVKNGKKFYCIDYKKGLSKEIDESKINYLPLSFDYPSYYASESKDGPFPYSEKIKTYTETKIAGSTTAAATTVGDDAAGTVTDKTTEPGATAEAPESVGSTEETTKPADTSAKSKKATLPAGVEEKDGKYYKVTESVKWGYRDAEGNTVITPAYKKAYPFTSSGYAAVIDSKSRVCFIDTQGNTVVSLVPVQKIKPDVTNHIAIHQVYLEPYSTGLKSIGSYFFDAGYVMTRYQWRATNNVSKIIKDENHLVDTKGNEFSIPEGYKLTGYSDGALLLERDGAYGYMSVNGSWIKPAVYKNASPYLQGLAAVQGSNGKYGLIDLNGDYVLPMCFDYISNVSGGLAAAYSEERGWEIYCVVSSPVSEPDTEKTAVTSEPPDTTAASETTGKITEKETTAASETQKTSSETTTSEAPQTSAETTETSAATQTAAETTGTEPESTAATTAETG